MKVNLFIFLCFPLVLFQYVEASHKANENYKVFVRKGVGETDVESQLALWLVTIMQILVIRQSFLIRSCCLLLPVLEVLVLMCVFGWDQQFGKNICASECEYTPNFVVFCDLIFIPFLPSVLQHILMRKRNYFTRWFHMNL